MLTRVLSAYGVAFAISADDAVLLARMAAHLPPGTAPADSLTPHRDYVLTRDGASAAAEYVIEADAQTIGRHPDIEDVLHRFESDLQLHVAERSPDRLFVHAGVVSWHGGAILLPGRTFSGKSRLVAELVQQGAGYYSDEYAVLDASGQVHAYPRPIALRRVGEHGVMRERVVPTPSPGGSPPLRVRAVFLCPFRPGSTWNPRRLSPSEAALAIVPHVVPARREPARMLAYLSRLVTQSPVFEAARDEASGAAADILSA
jgi:hypothetical protein